MKHRIRLPIRPKPGVRFILVFLAGLAVLAGCADPSGPTFTLWEGTLFPVPPSRIKGQTAAATQFGRTEVSVEIRLAEPEGVYLWRVESGDCQSEGEIKDGPLMYPPLTAGESGLASSNAVLSSLFKSGSSLAVKVYSWDGEVEVLVSCGSLAER
jgi:hypothetical protein